MRGMQWVVFEPNDATCRAGIRYRAGAFMYDLFRQGTFQGGKPQEAFRVNCDMGTTTQNDVDRGIAKILVGFASLRLDEFVIIRMNKPGLQKDWASEYQAIPELDANASAVAIETLTSQNEGWEQAE